MTEREKSDQLEKQIMDDGILDIVQIGEIRSVLNRMLHADPKDSNEAEQLIRNGLEKIARAVSGEMEECLDCFAEMERGSDVITNVFFDD